MKSDSLHNTEYDCRYSIYVSSKYGKPFTVEPEALRSAFADADVDGMEITGIEVGGRMVIIGSIIAPSLPPTLAAKRLLREVAETLGESVMIFAKSMLVMTEEAENKNMAVVDYLNDMKRYHGDAKRRLS